MYCTHKNIYVNMILLRLGWIAVWDIQYQRIKWKIVPRSSSNKFYGKNDFPLSISVFLQSMKWNERKIYDEMLFLDILYPWKQLSPFS